MASRGEELNTRLTATDDASKVIDKVAEKVEDLEDRPHEVDLTGDTDQVERELSALDKRLDGLTSEEKRVVLELAAKNAQRDIDRLNRDLAQAQNYDDDEINLRVNAKGDAERKLDKIQSEIRDIDGATPDIRPEVNSSSLDAFIDKLENLAGGSGALGAFKGKAGAGIAGGIAAGFILAGEAAANAAVEVDNIAKLTGASTEQASRLAGVMGSVGVEGKDLQDILLQMGGVLRDDADLAEALGININDGKDLTERFVQVVKALGREYKDTADRSLVASKLFGEEGVRQVNAVTAAYGDLSQAAEDYSGKVFTAEDIERAREYKRRLADIKIELQEITVEAGEGALPAVESLIRGAGFALEGFEALSGFNPGTSGGLEAHLERIERGSHRVADAAQRTIPAVEALDEALEESGESGRQAYEVIANEIDRAASNLRRFGADGVEQMGEVEEAAKDALSPFAELREQLDAEKTFDRLAESIERVKTKPGDRDEVRGLLEDVLDLGDAYEDIPPEVITDIFAKVNSGQIDEAFNEIQRLANQRQIRINVAVGGTSFRIDPDGGAPERIETPTTFNAGPSTVINNYQITPTTGQVVGATNANQFVNGSRSGPR